MQKISKVSTKKRFIFWFSLFVFVILALFFSMSFLSGYKKFTIQNINIYGADILDKSLIRKNIDQSISGKFYYLFSKRNFLIYPKEYIAKNLKDQFKIIDTVSVYVTDLNTLQVDISLRKPQALWCQRGEGVDISKCFFLDKNGFVFSPSPDFSGDAYLKYFGFLPFGDPVGLYFLNSPDLFIKVSSFLNSLKSIDISPLYTNASTSNSFEINLKDQSKIFFNPNDNLDLVFSRLQIFLNSKEWISENIKVYDLHYLDLRFDNKIFYKKK